ncbi:MAG: hypothetical protein WCZ87_07360 [Thiohalobacteraceae bacterium]
MTAFKLVLHPDCRIESLSAPAILGTLCDLGMLGEPFPVDGREHYLPGDAFLDHIVFLGCAPTIELAAPAHDVEAAARAGRFCHLFLHPVTPRPRARIRRNQLPRCPRCRSDIAADRLPPPADPLRESVCPHCGSTAALADLNWRQAGGHARIYLDIFGIYAGEAVPGDGLLDALSRTTAGRWSFFYIED